MDGTTILSTEGRAAPNPLSDKNPLIKERFIGFKLFAKAYSTGRGWIATFHSTVVYAPRSYSSAGKTYAPYGLRRAMSRPTATSPDAFDTLLGQSVIGAEAIIEDNLRHVIVKGFSQ